MEHCSEVAQIIQHALAGNIEGVKAYGELLAQKLDADGEKLHANIIRQKLTGKPPTSAECVYPQANSRNR